MLPGNKILNRITVDQNKVVKVFTLNDEGKEVEAPIESLNKKYALDPAYLLEIRDELKNCSEYRKLENDVKKLNGG